MNNFPKNSTFDGLAQMALDAALSRAARVRYLRALRKYAKRFGLHARALHNAVLSAAR